MFTLNRDPQTKKHGQAFSLGQTGSQTDLWHPIGGSNAQKEDNRWKGFVVRSERQLTTVNAPARRNK